jgi:hypothetical protein
MPSTVETIQNIAGNLGDIVRSEVQLARAEMREEASKAARAGAMMAAGAILGLLGMAFVFWTIAFGLTQWLPVWASSLVVGVLLLGTSGALLSMGRGRMRQVHMKPEQTMESVREDVQWIKSRT